MSRYANDNRKPGHERSPLRLCLLFAARVVANGLKRRERQRAIAALQALDDRVLEDIGIARYDIPDIVAEFFAPEKASGTPVDFPEQLPQLRQAA